MICVNLCCNVLIFVVLCWYMLLFVALTNTVLIFFCLCFMSHPTPSFWPIDLEIIFVTYNWFIKKSGWHMQWPCHHYTKGLPVSWRLVPQFNLKKENRMSTRPWIRMWMYCPINYPTSLFIIVNGSLFDLPSVHITYYGTHGNLQHPNTNDYLGLLSAENIFWLLSNIRPS